eukprot:3789392-Ditylum_brightwellii.AAC.1
MEQQEAQEVNTNSNLPTRNPTKSITISPVQGVPAQMLTKETRPVEPLPEDAFGMSKTELINTLKRCGIHPGDHKSLPELSTKVAEKGQNDNMKNQAIIEALQSTIYENAEVHITVQLLTNIGKRKWLSDHPMVTCSIITKGLSPFTVLEMSKELINELNKQINSIEAATNTTAKIL